MSLISSLRNASSGFRNLGTTSGQAVTALNRIKSSTGQASTGVNQAKNAANQANTALTRMRTSGDRVNSSFTKLRTSAGQAGTNLGTMKNSAGQMNTSLGQARTGADRLRSSLDRLRKAAGDSQGALKDVKRQADAVETSVGKAGKGADRTGKSMGGLGKGLKGASLAQKGLNLAMIGSPFGLIMTLLAPLIARFVNMDKIISTVKKTTLQAWDKIKDGTRVAVDKLKPLIEGYAKFMKLPVNALVKALNFIIPYLNKIQVKIPGWVPGIGGKTFGVHLSKLPTFAQGGIVLPRSGGTQAIIGEAGEPEAVIPLSKLRTMLGKDAPHMAPAAWQRLAAALERMGQRPVHVKVDSQTIARAVQTGERQLARR